MMIEYAERLIDHLSSNQNEFAVYPGFEDTPAAAPLLEKRAFVSVVSVGAGELAFKVSVFSPVSFGGTDCISCAETLLNILESDDCPFRTKGLSVGGGRYSSDSLPFVCELTGTIIDGERFSFTAEDFAGNGNMRISRYISSYKIRQSFHHEPVMTIFEDIPYDIDDHRDVFTITLYGVPREVPDEISGSGVFRLTLGGEVFERCRCIDSTRDEDRPAQLTLEGYRYNAGDLPIGPPIPVDNTEVS